MSRIGKPRTGYDYDSDHRISTLTLWCWWSPLHNRGRTYLEVAFLVVKVVSTPRALAELHCQAIASLTPSHPPINIFIVVNYKLHPLITQQIGQDANDYKICLFISFVFVSSFATETYRSRNRRAALGLLAPGASGDYSNRALNVLVAEKQILREFGPKACILEEPCKFHAHRPAAKGEQPDWDDILR